MVCVASSYEALAKVMGAQKMTNEKKTPELHGADDLEHSDGGSLCAQFSPPEGAQS